MSVETKNQYRGLDFEKIENRRRNRESDVAHCDAEIKRCNAEIERLTELHRDARSELSFLEELLGE